MANKTRSRRVVWLLAVILLLGFAAILTDMIVRKSRRLAAARNLSGLGRASKIYMQQFAPQLMPKPLG